MIQGKEASEIFLPIIGVLSSILVWTYRQQVFRTCRCRLRCCTCCDAVVRGRGSARIRVLCCCHSQDSCLDFETDSIPPIPRVDTGNLPDKNNTHSIEMNPQPPLPASNTRGNKKRSHETVAPTIGVHTHTHRRTNTFLAAIQRLGLVSLGSDTFYDSRSGESHLDTPQELRVSKV